MKKNEWITLGVGIVVIVFFAWLGGVFSLFSSNSSSNQSVNTTPKGVPVVTGQNISSDPKLQII